MGEDAPCLEFDRLASDYSTGRLTPSKIAQDIHRRIEQGRAAGQNAWLYVRPLDELSECARDLEARKASGETLPLFGIPFGVKDNIDVVGMPTTAACVALARTAKESAPCVQRLVQAGAMVVGKTNLDQLATGLVGVRSPFGVPTNPFGAQMIPGGSSSGSAVAVSAGEVSFALGTDTAGSGRVPAAFNNVVGLKPTRGLVSMRGVVPACRSLDCFSVFALTVGDACRVAQLAKGYDPGDPFSRSELSGVSLLPAAPPRPWRIGVPRAHQRQFFGDADAEATFSTAIASFQALGCVLLEVDIKPFLEAGELLYGGPWVAERLVVGGPLLAERPDSLLPVIQQILEKARHYDSLAAFEATYRLAALHQSTLPTWSAIDSLLVPTTPTIFTLEDVRANPMSHNTKLGLYTTFANLLDLTAVAVPAGLRADGLPAGVTLLGRAGDDAKVTAIAQAYHESLGGKLGATEYSLVVSERSKQDAAQGKRDQATAKNRPLAVVETDPSSFHVAVVGAHLSGQPLNGQLTSEGATLVRTARTAAYYRLFALSGTTPPKPGLIRVSDDGRPIEVEIWALDIAAAFGRFVARVGPPLCIGSIELEDGGWVHGFLCEPHAIRGARDITNWGGWRAYLSRLGVS